VRREVEASFDQVDYVEICDPETLEPLAGAVRERALIAVAARIGSTRLIDNTVLGEDSSP
jgi:pantothenate synthetase